VSDRSVTVRAKFVSWRASLIPLGYHPAPISGNDSGSINLAALNDWLAVPADYALREVLQAAEPTDHATADIDRLLQAEITAGGEHRAC
jgi:hypothetical protein